MSWLAVFQATGYVLGAMIVFFTLVHYSNKCSVSEEHGLAKALMLVSLVFLGGAVWLAIDKGGTVVAQINTTAKTIVLAVLIALGGIIVCVGANNSDPDPSLL